VTPVIASTAAQREAWLRETADLVRRQFGPTDA
jgi:hypothetical protein